MRKELLKYRDMKLAEVPDLQNRMPIVNEGIIVLSSGFIRNLTDGEFIVMCNCDLTFRASQQTMKLIKKRMLELEIDHSTELNKDEVLIKSN